MSRSESLSYNRCVLLLTNYRSWIHSLTGRLKGKPLLDMVGGVIEDYEFLWDQYYFPTATL
jgi:hypothetical protein